MSEQQTSNAERADAITQRRTIYAAGAGLIPVPVLDVATLLGVQIVMIRDIAKIYDLADDRSFDKNRVKHFIHVLIGDLGTIGVMSGVKAIPIVGTAVGVLGAPLVGAASTYALGKVFTQHFEQGGTLLDFDPESTREYFKEEFDKGMEVVQPA